MDWARFVASVSETPGSGSTTPVLDRQPTKKEETTRSAKGTQILCPLCLLWFRPLSLSKVCIQKRLHDIPGELGRIWFIALAGIAEETVVGIREHDIDVLFFGFP